MYADLHEKFELPVGLELDAGCTLRHVTLRPLVVGDMPRVADLAGDDPTVMDIDLARWHCQMVYAEGAEPVTVAQLRNLTEPDYEVFNAAAERIKKKLRFASGG